MSDPKKRRSGIGVGTISILTIFTILCLSVLALLSVTTVFSETKISEKTLQNILNISNAKTNLSLQLAELDSTLISIDSSNSDSYFESAIQQATSLGFSPTEADAVFTISHPVSPSSILSTKIELLPPDQEYRYIVLESVLDSSIDWQLEDEQSLWTG